LIPAENSLDNAHNGKWVRQAVERFVACGGSEPCVTLIGEDAESAGPCECKEQSELVLFTTYLAMESPLRCGACFQSVPLYCVPPTYMGEYWDLLNWEADYQACDTLQMHCDTLERAATREMSQLNSSLTQSGLQVCQQIQNLTEKPVYYYLYRNGGRSRKCPSCGGEWLLPEAWHKFDFKCEQCHLLSNIAWNVR
jgi:predicted  nucleic acid-binding Zn ribbon protein